MRKILRLNPSYYAFMSGLLMSPIIELIDNASFSTPENIDSFLYALAGGLFFALSGIFLLILSINLEDVKRLSFENTPRVVDSNVAWEKIVDSKKVKLYFLLLFSLLLSLIGIFVQSIAVIKNILS